MTESYQKMLEEYTENVGEGYFPNEHTVFRIMALERLDRIADALESIDSKLDMLTDCVGYIPPNCYQEEGCHIFRIGGSVDVN